MKIIADFHVHSGYSRATAKDLSLEHLYGAAQIKGVQVVGTGDFSHPAWFKEIQTKLEMAEPGLLRFKSRVAQGVDSTVPAVCRGIVRFILVTEISNIYKKEGRVRKNHNLVFMPDLDFARKFNCKIEKIGNIQSDGRPILGLDARDLLEIVLEISADAFLIPAHIWTPWFSMLGSRSGFDSIEECFGDLKEQIFAAETGLSSDPAMNWRVSFLDNVTLISNSDAHSPGNLGREANLFDTDLSYFALMDALKSGDKERFLGTIEFFPEEGKYHLDGHRNCGVRLEPRESMAHRGLCPQCGKLLTIGVLHRVEELSDRAMGQPPKRSHPYINLIGLRDILSEILQSGSKSQKVLQAYRTAIETLGPELHILRQMDPLEIKHSRIPLLDEAVKRMREKRVDIQPGFDGEYGHIKIFNAEERETLKGQRSFFLEATPQRPVPNIKTLNSTITENSIQRTFSTIDSSPIKAPNSFAHATMSEEQRRIIEYNGRHLLIVAGPGTGKTQTLTWRIAHQILQKKISPGRMLAITFTNKAANEMRSRLKDIIGEERNLPLVTTFHAFCHKLLLEDHPANPFGIIDEDQQDALLMQAVFLVAESGIPGNTGLSALKAQIMFAKQNLLLPEELSEPNGDTPEKTYLIAVYRTYQQLLEIQGLMDFEDLIFKVARRLDYDNEFRMICQDRFQHIYVDEYQDLNRSQHRIIRNLVSSAAGKNTLCVIGDPDQSIYGFRGSDSVYFSYFSNDYPDSAVLHLTRNYRSTNSILSASFQVINQDDRVRIKTYSTIEGVKTICIIEVQNEHFEAEAIAQTIERLIGGTGFHSLDTGQVTQAYSQDGLGYSDFAVLARTGQQLKYIADEFKTDGIPFQLNSRHDAFSEKGVMELLSAFKILSLCGSLEDFKISAALLAPTLNKKVLATFRDWCLKKRLSLKDGLVAAARFPIPGLNRNQQLDLTAFIGRLSALERETASLKEKDRLLYLINHPLLSECMSAEKTRETINRIVEMVGDSGNDDRGVLNQIVLCTDTDLYHPRAEKVALMTMHAAKGLEFEVVFIVGCEDELIPYRRSSENDSVDREEERRLFYVAMTRAKKRLYLTWAGRRRVFGKTLNRKKSPFMNQIEARFLHYQLPQGSSRRKKPDQLQLF